MTRQWSTLYRVPDVGLDKKTAAQAAELNERIDALETERQAADEMRADFLAADPADAASPGLHFTGYREVLDAARMQCLAHEVALRQDVAAFLERPRREAMTAAREQANAAHEQVRERIEKALLALGYEARDPWLKGMTDRHPEVHEARETARAAGAHAADRTLQDANQTALDQVRAEIDQRRAAAVA